MLLSACSRELGSCCHDPGIISLISITRNIMDLIQIIVPIILIIFLTVQLTKLVVNPEEKNGLKKVINQILATFMVFLVPVIINAVINIMPQTYQISACWNVAGGKDEVSMSKSLKYLSTHEDKPGSIAINPNDYEDGDSGNSNDTGQNSSSSGDSGNNLSAGDAQGIIEGAKKVHDTYEQQKWHYYSNLNQLKWNDIKYSTNNPSKATCCATFVGSAFLVGGVFTEKEINKYNYNSQHGISELCKAHNWIKITSYKNLAPGDIVIMTSPSSGSAPGHVQIYAGNGTWYNAGSTKAIQRKNPYSYNASGRFLYAWRIPK